MAMGTGDDAAGDEADARAQRARRNDDRGRGNRSAGGLAALCLLTGLALAVGGLVGVYLADAVENMVEERTKAAEQREPVQLRFTDDTILMRLEPVTANLGDPADVWVRLETAILFRNGDLANPEAAAAEIAQDILSYMKTVTLEELEGASALLFLREDLNDRVAIRTGGRVEELLIETMVVQ